MTRSFTAILLAFQRLGLQFVGDNQYSAALDQLPQRAQEWRTVRRKRSRNSRPGKSLPITFSSGKGAHYWLAQEAGLKVTEMFLFVCAGFYHSLEFRHGPRSVAGPKTLITLFHFRSGGRRRNLAGERTQAAWRGQSV